MCTFLSAIVPRWGEIICDPEHTDHHTDLIEAFGLREGVNAGNFVRVEFIPGGFGTEMLDLSTWNLRLDEDEDEAPSWWDAERLESVRASLTAKVERVIVTESKPILLGGFYILGAGADIAKVQGSRIVLMTENAQVGVMAENSRVREIRGNAQVGVMWDNSQVGVMVESAHVGTMTGNSHVGIMRDNSRVGTMRDNSQVGVMVDNSKVGVMWDNARAPRPPVTDKRTRGGVS